MKEKKIVYNSTKAIWSPKPNNGPRKVKKNKHVLSVDFIKQEINLAEEEVVGVTEMQAMHPETVQCSISGDTVICEDQLITMEHGEEIMLDAGMIQNQIDLEEVGLEEQFEDHTEITQELEMESETTVVPQESRLMAATDSQNSRSAANTLLNELGKSLLTASKLGKTEEVKQLMAKGAPFTCDWLGTSALHLAALNNNKETVEILLRAGISRDSRTKVDKTALHLACTEGHTTIVKLLLRNGADVNACDMLRMTPLHWAVDREHTEVIRSLLEHGANPSIVSKFDKTAFTIATDNNRPDLIKYMQTIKPMEMGMSDEADLAMHEATLAATDSIALEMGQVPAVSQQEEVETSNADASKYYEDEEALHEGQEIHLEETHADTSSNIDGTLVQTTQTIEYLQSHGITMLPMDESTLAESALESGGKVVLTEAGKLALAKIVPQKTKGSSPKLHIQRKKLIAIRKHPGRKIILKSPNILKRIDEEMVEEMEITPTIASITADGDITMVHSVPNHRMYEMKAQLDEARQKAADAQRLAKDAQRQTKEARLQMKQLKERLSKMEEENEQCRNLIQTLQK